MFDCRMQSVRKITIGPSRIAHFGSLRIFLKDGKGWGHKRGDLKMPFST